jgi:hypothetical protein
MQNIDVVRGMGDIVSAFGCVTIRFLDERGVRQ